MSEIKAIETRYKGFLFRSRLEARFAVFFDAMDELWEYEKEGFVLSDGSHYLPDFYLPRFKLYLEVKGAKPTEAERKKCEMLRDGGHSIILTQGLPTENLAELFCWDITDSSGGTSEWDVVICNDYYGNLALNVLSDSRQKDRIFFANEHENAFPVLYGECPNFTTAPAYDKAKSARFEHGESPS